MFTRTIKATLIAGAAAITMLGCSQSHDEVLPNLTSRGAALSQIQYSTGDSLLIGLGVFDLRNQSNFGFEGQAVHQSISRFSVSHTSLAADQISFEFKWNGNTTQAQLDCVGGEITIEGGGVPTGAIVMNIADSVVLSYTEGDLNSPEKFIANLAVALKIAFGLDRRTPVVPTTPMAPNFRVIGRGTSPTGALNAAIADASKRCGALQNGILVRVGLPSLFQDKNGNWIVVYTYACVANGETRF